MLLPVERVAIMVCRKPADFVTMIERDYRTVEAAIICHGETEIMVINKGVLPATIRAFATQAADRQAAAMRSFKRAHHNRQSARRRAAVRLGWKHTSERRDRHAITVQP